MSKLARCPLCGGEMFEQTGGDQACQECYLSVPHRVLPRLARLVRKGKMFEWLERQQQIESTYSRRAFTDVVYSARDWWRERRKR